MFKRIMLGLVVLAIVAAAIHFVNKRYFTAEEEHVRAVIETVISHMESDNVLWSVDRIRAQLSDKYRHYGEGSSTAIGKAYAVRFVMGLKQRCVGFEVEVHAMTVSVSGDTAQVEMIGRVTAAPKSNPEKRVEVIDQARQEPRPHRARERRRRLDDRRLGTAEPRVGRSSAQ